MQDPGLGHECIEHGGVKLVYFQSSGTIDNVCLIQKNAYKCRKKCINHFNIIRLDHGTTYIRWARKQCPNNNTELVYSGFAAGGYYNDEGSSAEPVCLPQDSDFGKTSGQDLGRIYGAEFDDNFFASDGDGEDVPCAVCRVKHASSVIMMPGKNKCYTGWNIEYHGYLAAGHHLHKAAGTYVCIDIKSEFLTGGSQNDNGKLFYEVLAKCGSLQCPPYKNNYPLTCVVCSK